MPEPIADEVLLASVELARTALLEITDASSVGSPAGHVLEGDGTFSLLFECTKLGYPDWYWTVSLARAGDDAQPTVLEAELMPGAGSLLAPDWVPWADRLAEYQASQDAAKADVSSDDADDDDEDDDTDLDDADLDDSDFDGVDIDSFHEEITGVELAALEQQDDDADEAEDDTDDGGPDDPEPVDGGERAGEAK